VLIGTLAALSVAVPAFASPPSISSKQAEARQVEQQVNALNADLGRADELLNYANLKLARVGKQIVLNRRELRIAKANLAKSQQTIARRLVMLYTKGQPSTLEVILGANSIDEILSRVDTENRVSSLDDQVIAQVQTFKASVKVHARRLAVERRQVKHLVAERRTQERAIAVRLGERRRLLSSLNDEIRRLVAAHDAAVRAAEMRAAQAARSRYDEAQASQQNAYDALAIGATAQTAEGTTVLPPSTHGGVVGVALSYLGTQYVWGGGSPGGFDCSGLVMWSYAQVGVSLPHSSYAQWNYGVPVPEDQLQPGDLVFFDGLGHVGIYIGGGQFVHAPHTGDVVKVSSLSESYYAAAYAGARRIT
jgi:cell wall-associated NlpC family hydrolase